MFLFSFPFYFLLSCAFFVSPTKRAWFGNDLRASIFIILSCSSIRDHVKESRDAIHQLVVVNLPKWKVDTNTKNYGSGFLKIKSTNFSSFLSIPHCLHYMTKDLNLENNRWMVSKLSGWRAINSFSKTWPLNSSCFPHSYSSFLHTSFGIFNPSRWKSNSLEIWMHMKPNATSILFRYFDFSRGY